MIDFWSRFWLVLGASWAPFGGPFGSFWRSSWAKFGLKMPFEGLSSSKTSILLPYYVFQYENCVFDPKTAPKMAQDGLLDRSWAFLGRSWSDLARLGANLGSLGAILEPLGAILGRSWALLGRSWGDLGRPRGVCSGRASAGGRRWSRAGWPPPRDFLRKFLKISTRY